MLKGFINRLAKEIRGTIKLNFDSVLGNDVIINGKVKVGNNCVIDPYTRINAEPIIKIGDNFYANVFCWIAGKIEIGNNVLIGPHVRIIGRDHGIERNTLINQQKRVYKTIIIKDDVWIGGGATILKGVTINEGAVIAAGAVVTKDVPEFTVVGGVPAKVIKKR